MTRTNPETIASGAARLRAEISGHLACVTISYPERHNIIDLEGWLAFPDMMARLVDNQDVRLIVLRGDGGTCATKGVGTEPPEVSRVNQPRQRLGCELHKGWS